MIDISIIFSSPKGRDLEAEFATLPEKLRKNFSFLAHLFSMLDTDTVVTDIRTSKLTGKPSIICGQRDRDAKIYNRTAIPKNLTIINNLLGRSHKFPAFTYNQFSTPCTFEVFG